LNDGQTPSPNVVRVAPGTGYCRVEGNRRASRNGRVSDLPPETTNVTIRTFSIAVRAVGMGHAEQGGGVQRCRSCECVAEEFGTWRNRKWSLNDGQIRFPSARLCRYITLCRGVLDVFIIQ
jgi:hypothetical protein